MAVTAALLGSALIGGLATAYGSSRASKANRSAAQAAADATVESTRMQVEEMRRQFDEQMRMLAPLIQNQYGANSTFAALLGFDGYDPKTGSFTGRGPQVGQDGFRDPNLDPRRLGGATAQDTELGRQTFTNTLAGATPGQDLAIRRAEDNRLYAGVDQDSLVQQTRGRQNAPGEIGNDLAVQNVINNRAAGPAGADPYLNRTNDTRLAAPSMAQDERFRFAQDTEVVGRDFRTSPGYEFSVEQGQREVDRKNSAGGNYGGRALLEAQRRTQGTADQEYYNWVRARQGDLGRQDSAAAAYQGREAYDIGRGDTSMENYLQRRNLDIGRGDAATQSYLGRRGQDIGREDAAVSDSRRREELDLARGDAALDNYFSRRGGDLSRQDQAITNNQQLNEFDLRRQDQAYYNYLQQLATAGGAGGNSVGQAVGASGAVGAGVSNAYANQGNSLANIYRGAGENEANIQLGAANNYNNTLQSLMSNWLLKDYLGQ